MAKGKVASAYDAWSETRSAYEKGFKRGLTGEFMSPGWPMGKRLDAWITGAKDGYRAWQRVNPSWKQTLMFAEANDG